jgi:hypothetical protein
MVAHGSRPVIVRMGVFDLAKKDRFSSRSRTPFLVGHYYICGRSNSVQNGDSSMLDHGGFLIMSQQIVA